MSSYEMMGAWFSPPAMPAMPAMLGQPVPPASPESSAPPAPSAQPATDSSIKAAALPMEKFKRIEATYLGMFSGHYNSSTFSKDKYTWAMACAKRLESLKWIPRNTLEFSRTIKESAKDGWNNVAWYYNEASKVKYILYDEYFATLQLSASPGSGTSLYDFMNLLCMWELTGISLVKQYNDEQLIRNSGIPASKLPVFNYTGYDAALLEKFMRDYYDAVLSFADKVTAHVMSQSAVMNVVSKQFNLNTIAEYIRAVRAGFLNQGFIDSVIGRLFPTEFFYTDEVINGVKKSGFVAPAVGVNPIVSIRQGTILTEYKYDQKIYNVAGIPFLFDKKSVYQILQDIWKAQILPAQIQLEKMMVQWDFLQSDPTKLSKQDIIDLQNPDVNLFLRYNVEKTTEMKQVVMDQLAKSNVTRNTDKSVVPPQLQNRVQSVINLPKTYAKFTPKYTYIPEGKVPSHFDDPKKFPFGLLIAGVAVAAGAYYSTK